MSLLNGLNKQIMLFNFIYTFVIKLYFLAVLIASIFNKKARLWIKGRKNWYENIVKIKDNIKNSYWFHVSSLGEFEQARPLIEKIKKQKPEQKIVLTFFSPSGFEIRKNYPLADYVTYIPLDTVKNAKKFIEIVKPQKVIFVKYDFWYNFIKLLHKKNIEIYLVSGIFRKNQFLFKKIAKKYRNLLFWFTHLFVQDDLSVEILMSNGLNNVTKCGDTRFDRVVEIAENSNDIEIVKKFVNEKFCIIAGSTWLEDENKLSEFFNNITKDIKLIIAPHNIEESRIIEILKLFNRKLVRFSKADLKNVSEFDILIIDNIGMLSSIYKYGKIAYIGGGFGYGIHNIIEAAVYGMPVIFGPKYKKFNEAIEMIKINAAFSINDSNDLKKYFNMFLNDNLFLENISEKAKNYVYSNKGASEFILKKILN